MTPAGTSNELDVQNGWEENTHTHIIILIIMIVIIIEIIIIAPVAQLVTSKPFETLRREFESR